MAKKQICGIYKITNKINGKIYIGQSVDIEERFREHKRIKNLESLVAKSIKKYGVDNFDFEILLECEKDSEHLDYFEIEYIKEYNCKTPNGYNIANGGSNYKKPTEEQLQKLSERNKGENNPMFGRGEERLGDKNPMWGRTHSDEYKNILSEKFSGEKNLNARPVVDIFGNRWSCLNDCRKDLNISNHFCEMLSGKRPMARHVAHLDLHYEDDNNWIPKTKEEIENFKNRNMKGENNHMSKKIGDRNGRIWDTLNSASIELIIEPGSLSSMIKGKKKMRKDLIPLSLHYIN